MFAFSLFFLFTLRRSLRLHGWRGVAWHGMASFCFSFCPCHSLHCIASAYFTLFNHPPFLLFGLGWVGSIIIITIYHVMSCLRVDGRRRPAHKNGVVGWLVGWGSCSCSCLGSVGWVSAIGSEFVGYTTVPTYLLCLGWLGGGVFGVGGVC